MSRRSEFELKPRNGHTLMVRVVCRISGCQNQKELSLDDQLAYAQEYVADLYAGPIEFRVIATKGKGEDLDRPELIDIEAAYQAAEDDLFVYDDIGRLIRGGDAVRLFGIGVDHGIRSIGINDDIDTVRPTWEADALEASSKNVAHNDVTSMRIKQKTMNRHEKLGITPKRPTSGYIVRDDAKSFDDWRKDPEAEEPFQHAFEILRETLCGAEAARYFKKIRFPQGPLARKGDWDGTKVLRLFRNPILKGMPGRGFKRTQKHHATGKRPSKRNPKGPKHYHAPHLAFFDPIEFDELTAALAHQNRDMGRKSYRNGADVRTNVPKKQTRFPGQHSVCWYCGFHHVWGANGITDSLMCSNARAWHCWNSIGFNGELAAKALMQIVTAELYTLDAFDDQYRELVERAGKNDPSVLASRWERLQAEERKLAQMHANVIDAIAQYGKEQFQAKMDEIQAGQMRLRLKRRELERIGKERIEVPESTSMLRELLEQEFVGAAMDSPEFGSLMRKLCPDIAVHLVRLCDGGHLLPRARVRMALDGIIRDRGFVPGLDGLLRRDVTIDLFVPSQRERIRIDAVRLRSEGLGPKAIASAIAQQTSERPTSTAVQNALKLHDHMAALALESPYVLVTAPPDDYSKLRRHKNEAYRFTPREGYVSPPLE